LFGNLQYSLPVSVINLQLQPDSKAIIKLSLIGYTLWNIELIGYGCCDCDWPFLFTVAAAAYRPPSARGKPASTKLHEFEPPSNQKNQPPEEKLSKTQKRNLAKKRAKEVRN